MAEPLSPSRAIVTWPAPVLREPARPAPPPGRELDRLLEALWAACEAAGGAGLAAPQLGVAVRAAVVNGPLLDPASPRLELLDPVLVGAEGRQRGLEGCLSLPGVELPVTRPRSVTVRARDRSGAELTLRGSDLLARALCHELDHLEGVLILDRVPPWRRRLAELRLVRRLRPARASGAG